MHWSRVSKKNRPTRSPISENKETGGLEWFYGMAGGLNFSVLHENLCSADYLLLIVSNVKVTLLNILFWTFPLFCYHSHNFLIIYEIIKRISVCLVTRWEGLNARSSCLNTISRCLASLYLAIETACFSLQIDLK
jgi:hypothetical protein